MSDQFRAEPNEFRDPNIRAHVPFLFLCPTLPAWLASRWLRSDEEVTWVRGPLRNPDWERFATHPCLTYMGLVSGGLWLFLIVVALAMYLSPPIWKLLGSPEELPVLPAMALGAVAVACLVVVGTSSGHFTRLVVTTHRILILQGYELRQSWSIDCLPRSLIRYVRAGDDEARPAVDLDALKGLFGKASDQVADAKSIMALGKRLRNITAMEPPTGESER